MSRFRTLLLVAFHYPPCAVSSGVQRTLSFSKYLRNHGWRAVVLTAGARAYERTDPHQLAEIPNDVAVTRAAALDGARHLAFRGRYWSRLAIPDRWLSWWLSAVPKGLRLIKRESVDAIWSTYPIATAHLIGATLARLGGVPWIADFRDPMVEYFPQTGEIFPEDPALRRARLHVEAITVRHASRLVFCTNAAGRIVTARYPEVTEQRVAVIQNGFDEQSFCAAESVPPAPRLAGRRVLLHSGTVYASSDRDPTTLLQAIKTLALKGVINSGTFELRLRDPGHERYFRQLGIELGVAEFLTILPPLPYREALAEMLSADGLLLLQGHTSNPAVPAKLYEYLRARRPILALVHPDGETATTLRSLGIDTMASLTDVPATARLISEWFTAASKWQDALPAPELVAEFSRERLTARLACVLEDVLRGTRDATRTSSNVRA